MSAFLAVITDGLGQSWPPFGSCFYPSQDLSLVFLALTWNPFFPVLNRSPPPASPHPTSFPIFPFSVKSLTISPVICVWKLARGRGSPYLRDKASLFIPFFHALPLVRSAEDSSFAEPFSSSPLLCRIGDYLRSSLNLYYLKDSVWLRASCPCVNDSRRKQWPPSASCMNVAIYVSVWA